MAQLPPPCHPGVPTLLRACWPRGYPHGMEAWSGQGAPHPKGGLVSPPPPPLGLSVGDVLCGSTQPCLP